MYRSILVPVDISETELTQKVIPHVEYLARLSNAKVKFFHTLPISSAIINAFSFGYDEFNSYTLYELSYQNKQFNTFYRRHNIIIK